MSDQSQTSQNVESPKVIKKETPPQTLPIQVPYLNSYGVITKALVGIKTASTPDRFTQDFLSTKLGLKGGSAMPVIPFLKKAGFLNSDGTPTDLYKEFRNPTFSAKAAGRAVRRGYAPLYEINEYAHELNDNDLKGIIVQLTGLNSSSKTVAAILHSFKAIKEFAKFEDDQVETERQPSDIVQQEKGVEQRMPYEGIHQTVGLKLGYVINLNLPATSDVAVFDAIFESLRKHILE